MTDLVKQEAPVAVMSDAAHFELVVKQADVLAKSSIVPKAYRGKSADIIAAGLAGKRNWKQYKNAMLTWRAVSKLCRYLFPDVVLGAGLVPEELGAEVNSDGEVLQDTDEKEADFENDPFGSEWISPAEAKNQLLEACDGDKELAKQIWGERGSDSLPQESVDTLITQAIATLDMKKDHEDQLLEDIEEAFPESEVQEQTKQEEFF